MKAKFLGSEGEYLDATVEIGGQLLHVMDGFTYEGLYSGDIVNIEVSTGLYDDSEEWESMFSGNPEARKDLEHQSGWCYRAYGIISSINPVMVDVGSLQVEAPIQSNDDRLVGEPIAFTIKRLDAWPTTD